ncbi:hypothetical protein LCGC14_0476920 [marine sediment metagenome]|uniref:Uncharacterized protein n=1 Tax=marine sediment metagenome TaxID=412755 RepID=A0A0F9SAF7_9ZZZZ
MKRTNKLDEITVGTKSNFTWGEAIKIHSIGEYHIVEHYPHEFVGNCSTGRINYSEKEYSCYTNGNSISRSTMSLDSALVKCIAYKYEGSNSQAAHFFMKMINHTIK